MKQFLPQGAEKTQRISGNRQGISPSKPDGGYDCRDTLCVTAADISDWVYYRNGQATGNYLDKLLEEREKKGSKGR